MRQAVRALLFNNDIKIVSLEFGKPTLYTSQKSRKKGLKIHKHILPNYMSIAEFLKKYKSVNENEFKNKMKKHKHILYFTKKNICKAYPIELLNLEKEALEESFLNINCSKILEYLRKNKNKFFTIKDLSSKLSISEKILDACFSSDLLKLTGIYKDHNKYGYFIEQNKFKIIFGEF